MTEKYVNPNPIFLGGERSTFDSLNKHYPKIFDLYKQQKAQDWSEDEFSYEQSRIDFERTPESVSGVMLEILKWQWEADSVVAKTLLPAFAPFISDDTYAAAITKQTEIECVVEGTQVLTPSGWKDIKDIQIGDQVLQYDIDTKAVQFVKNTGVVSKPHKGKVFYFSNERGQFKQKVTPNHRMLAKSRNGNFKTELAEDMEYASGFGGVNTGIMNNPNTGLTAFEKLLIAVQADGCVDWRGDGSATGLRPIHISLKKERKIERLKNICQEADVELKQLMHSKEGFSKFVIHLPIKYDEALKTLNWVDLSKVSKQWADEFLYEVSIWDGHKSKKNYSVLITTNESVAKVVQAVATLGGYKTHYSVREDGRSENFMDCFRISWTEKPYVNGASIHKVVEDYDGQVYCLTVPSSYFIIRQDGAVSVTGNCLHALTYSEIVRQCLKNPEEVLAEIANNPALQDRMKITNAAFEDLIQAGIDFQVPTHKMCCLVKDPMYFHKKILKGLFAVTVLEGLSFMASFACTFALDAQDLFQGIAQSVQKIMLDEILHTKIDIEALKETLKDDIWQEVFQSIKPEIKEMLDEAIACEERFSHYIFSEGRAVVGLNTPLLIQWVYYNAAPFYDMFGIERSFEAPKEVPIPYMITKMEIDKEQNANQEQQNGAYLLNTIADDVETGLLPEVER